MEFEFIGVDSIFLKSVMKLGKKNSSTLGFLPEGGFIEHAKKKWILIAKEDNVLLGYVLFRIALRTNILSIAHLCIDDKFRGKGTAIHLLDQIKLRYESKLSGILLSCRSDYAKPSKLWKDYGFISKNKVRSRSQDEKYLIKWWYSFNQEDLFSFYEDSSKHSVLLDMNILIKLRDRQNNIEVQALLADWLVDEVEYYFAPEFYSEILRDKNNERIQKTRTFVESNFSEAKFNKAESSKVYQQIIGFFKNNRANDVSDINQISDCVAAGIKYFITLDTDILDVRDKIEDLFDISILSPSEFILKVDMLKNDSNYHPYRLAGATHTFKQAHSENLNSYIDQFLRNDKGETKAAFKNLVQSIVNSVPDGCIQTVNDKEYKPIAFWGYAILDNSIKVKFIRTIANSLQITLFTQLVFEIINIAISNGKFVIEIEDDFYCINKTKVLFDFGFFKIDSSWKKIAIKDIINSGELTVKYPIVGELLDARLQTIINEKDEEQRKYNLYKLERILYPLKFEDLDIPCYIIPIKRYWAGQLFDKYNTNADMFGASPQKIWNRENVYYRSIKPVSESFPARVIWYVSEQKYLNRQKSIVAVSYLDNMSVDNVKEQFRKFKKFGIYEWEHIFELAGNNDKNDIKALQFSDTEVFKNEINFKKITDILLQNNTKRNTFASPLKVSNAIFSDIYKLALI